VAAKKLTAKQLQSFDGYVTKWQTKLGLLDWDVYRSSEAPPPAAMADVDADILSHMARLRVGDWGGAEPTPASIEATALHELLHILLAEMRYACSHHSKDWNLVMGAEHRAINTLTRLLLKDA
jgi:hypothetical protein